MTLDETSDYEGRDTLTLDANAAAGMLMEIFGTEMTIAASRCTHCGNRAQIGTLRAYMNAPGLVLRCSVCAQVVMRVMRREDGSYLVDARGAAYIRM
jgi:NAD-dependent SIR2 family protein deacetylase